MLEILKNPSCWYRNYQTDKTIDKFFRLLIENKDEVEVVSCDDYNLEFIFRGFYYKVWIANRWYAYLKDIVQYELMCDGKTPLLLTDCYTGGLPSRKTAFEFYHTFHEPNIQVHDELKFLKDVLKGETKND